MTRQEIIELIRNEHNPAPDHISPGTAEAWDDGAEAIADKIVAGLQPGQVGHPAQTDGSASETLGAVGARRAMARIVYELIAIKEEGLDESGKPNWYALDRFAAIASTANLAAAGNPLACVGGALSADIEAVPAIFDRLASVVV